MKTYIGEVIEVYIPPFDENGNKADIMYSTRIGFKVMVNNEIVLITEQVINNKKFIDIEIYEGDGNE